MNHQELEKKLKAFVADSYPNMVITVGNWPEDSSKIAIYFVEEKFSLIYPMQRFHYLNHLIPQEFQKQYMENTYWFELAPGEDPASLEYPDDELIGDITPDVMKILYKVGFFEALDDLLCPATTEKHKESCHGDFRHSKSILPRKGFNESEYFDVFHVLMAQGGNCDCEILYNVSESNRLKSKYWITRANGKSTDTKHH